MSVAGKAPAVALEEDAVEAREEGVEVDEHEQRKAGEAASVSQTPQRSPRRSVPGGPARRRTSAQAQSAATPAIQATMKPPTRLRTSLMWSISRALNGGGARPVWTRAAAAAPREAVDALAVPGADRPHARHGQVGCAGRRRARVRSSGKPGSAYCGVHEPGWTSTISALPTKTAGSASATRTASTVARRCPGTARVVA